MIGAKTRRRQEKAKKACDLKFAVELCAPQCDWNPISPIDPAAAICTLQMVLLFSSRLCVFAPII